MRDWTIDEATPAQRRELLEIEERLFSPESALRARWLFDANPAGKALVLVAASPGGRLLGTRALLPWKLRAGGETVTVGQYSRTWTLPEARRRGISVAIGEELNARSRALGYPLLFLFPSVRSIPGHRRIGNTLDTLLERRQVLFCPKLLWSGAPGFLDGVFRLGWKISASGVKARSWGLEDDPARAADRIENGSSAFPGVTGVRDYEFVNWRYSRNSGRVYEGWRYPDRGPARLLAFVHRAGTRARIVDLLGDGDPEEVAGAVRGLVEQVSKEMWMVEWCPSRWSPRPMEAARAGMLRRRTGVPLARWFNRDRETLGDLADVSRYRLTEGDSDYA